MNLEIQYLPLYESDFKGIVANWALPFLHARLLEITLTVPLNATKHVCVSLSGLLNEIWSSYEVTKAC